MPPFSEKKIPSSKIKYMRQSATLTSFGSPIFDNLYTNIAIIHSIFQRAIGERLLEGTVQSTFAEYPAIDVANRYFTPTVSASPEDICPLTDEVDPLGTLAKAAGTAYVHTEDNKVYYSKKTSCKNGDAIFQPTGPQTFQVGDIVEVQVSFIAVPIRDNKWKISTILRSISLFDTRYTQEAFVKSHTLHAITERPKTTLKRKVGYLNEQVSSTRAKMAEMNIADDIDGVGKKSATNEMGKKNGEK